MQEFFEYKDKCIHELLVVELCEHLLGKEGNDGLDIFDVIINKVK